MTNRRALARRSILAASVALLSVALIAGTSGASSPSFDSVKISGSRGFEPGVDIASDGTMFANEPLGFPGHSVLYRSTNGGTSYQQIIFPSPYSRLPGGGDSDVEVAIGPNGKERVYFIDLWVGSYSIIISDDNGDTWNWGSPLTFLPATDRAWIESGGIDPATGEQKVYLLTSPMGPGGLTFARSNDGGRTFPLQKQVPGIIGAASQSGQLVADGDFVAFPYNSGNKRWVATSIDAGDTWTTALASTFAGVQGSISALAYDDVTGAMHTVWTDSIYNNGISVASSYDGGVTWQGQKNLYSSGRSQFPWIAAADGKVAVAWYAAEGYFGTPDSAGTNVAWSVKYAESTDDGVSYGGAVSAVNVARKGHICTQGLACNSGRDLGDFLQVVIDGDGRAVISHGSTASSGSGGMGVGLLVTRQH